MKYIFVSDMYKVELDFVEDRLRRSLTSVAPLLSTAAGAAGGGIDLRVVPHATAAGNGIGHEFANASTTFTTSLFTTTCVLKLSE